MDADWSPDGKNLAVVHLADGRFRLEYPIGKVLYKGAAWLSHVRISPDGSLIAFLDHQEVGESLGVLKVVDTNGRVRIDGASEPNLARLVPRRDGGLDELPAPGDCTFRKDPHALELFQSEATTSRMSGPTGECFTSSLLAGARSSPPNQTAVRRT